MRCRRARFVALVVALAAAELAGEGIFGGRSALSLEAGGRYRLLGEGALRMHDPAEPTRWRARSEVELRVREGFTWRATVAIRAFRDWALDRSGTPAAVRELEGSEMELRELTFGVAIDRFDLVVGKRQVAWGALYGQFVADRVMPFDLRDFLLPDADFIRRPLWMVGALATGEHLSGEALLILERRADLLPVSGSEFAFDSGPAAVLELDASRVALGDAEPALRVEGHLRGIDASVFALAAHPDRDPLATTGELGERDPVWGVTAAAAVGAYALRGEVAVEHDRPLAPGGTRDIVRAGAVIDRALPRAQMLSLQGVHESAAFGMTADGRTEVAVRWAGDPSGGRWTSAVEYHQGLDGDWLVRPRASVTIASAWLAEWGIDWFGGRDGTPYGMFDGQDRMTLTLTHTGSWSTK